MALMGCLGCEGTYEIGSPRCPHCGTRSPMFVGGEDMPKATSGGASNAWEEVEAVAAEVVEHVEELAGHGEAQAAPVPAAAEVTGEHGPEPTKLPEGDLVAPGPVSTGESDGSPTAKAAPESAVPDPAVPAVPPVASMSKAELQDHAASLGLPTSGPKADLAARIVEHVETQGAPAAEAQEPATAAGEEPAPPVSPEA